MKYPLRVFIKYPLPDKWLLMIISYNPVEYKGEGNEWRNSGREIET